MDRSRNRTRLALEFVVAALFLGALGWRFWPRPSPPPTEKGSPDAGPNTVAADDRGARLYARHCAGCHGDTGDGNGPAARFLAPRPRDFTEGKFRIVTTATGLPSDDDLKHVIEDGMPGSAMFAFRHLGESDVRALVGQVRRLVHRGVEARVRKKLVEDGDEPDAAAVAERVDKLTAVGTAIDLPALPPADAAAVARGRELYVKGCAPCHGPTGKGDGPQDQKNDDGMPTRPRDLTLGIFKGGRDVRQVYARIWRGLPGSPMPGSTYMPAGDIGDLIHYVLSLAPAGSWERVEHRRQEIVARRVAALPETPADPTWDAGAVPVVVTPLWWREGTLPGLRVAARHDGRTLAVRLSWDDTSANDRADRPEDFEDMAAVQWFKGAEEPFLGMGSAGDVPIDVWLWRASWAAPPSEADSVLDDYPFDRPIYQGLTKGREKDTPDFRTARAAGNPHARDGTGPSASGLTAKGFGTTTFLPKTSQHVAARAEWRAGRWAVVLRRPLTVPAGEGLTLEPSGRCSVAFAVWDGAARERNGQKSVSVWQDFVVE